MSKVSDKEPGGPERDQTLSHITEVCIRQHRIRSQPSDKSDDPPMIAFITKRQ